MRDNRSNHQPRDTEFEEKMIQVSRVSKKTKGGNNVGFSVLMVVGDRKGRVGVGLGKASDVATAMRKGAKKAKKKMILVPLRGTTIPFKVVVKEGAGVVMLKPAPKGSGIIAGGPVRAVVDAAGIRDISSKILGSSNKASSVYATFEALKQIQRLVALRNLPIAPAAAIAPTAAVVAAAQPVPARPTKPVALAEHKSVGKKVVVAKKVGSEPTFSVPSATKIANSEPTQSAPPASKKKIMAAKTKAVTKPVVKPIETPTAKPITKPITKPIEKPIKNPAAKPIKKVTTPEVSKPKSSKA